MTVSLVQAIAGPGTGSGATTFSTSLGSLPTTGNLLIAFLADLDSRTLNSVKDNQGAGNSFTQLLSVENNGVAQGAVCRASIYYLIAPSGTTGTYTVTATYGGAETGEIWLIEVSGLQNPAATDGTNNSNSALVSGNITTTVTDLVVALSVDNGGSATDSYTVAATASTSGTWTKMAGEPGSTFMEAAWAVQPNISTVGSAVAAAAAGTYGATFSDPNSGGNAVTLIAAFKATVGGAAVEISHLLMLGVT